MRTEIEWKNNAISQGNHTCYSSLQRAPEYERLLYSELCLRKCQSVQQNFAQMYDISKNFFILYDECLIFIPNLIKMYIQSN